MMQAANSCKSIPLLGKQHLSQFPISPALQAEQLQPGNHTAVGMLNGYYRYIEKRRKPSANVNPNKGLTMWGHSIAFFQFWERGVH